MSTPPLFKRQRLNNPNINKPFRSPFRNLGQADSPERASQTSVATPGTGLEVDSRSSAEILQDSKSCPSPTLPTGSQSTPRNPALEPARTPAMTSESRRVTSSIIATRATVSTLQQALKILEDPDRSEQLAALSEKWRSAARLAADEVYASARDKINRIGGVGAWRENELERREWRRSWDEKETKGDAARAESDADYDARRHDDGYEGREGSDWDAVRDDDGFTMGMMLRSMNIDFEAIGYSEELQTWT